MGNVRLQNGDCLELMKAIPAGSVDMILCDLPYGTTRNSWDIHIDNGELWIQYRRIIKDNGAIVLFASGAFGASLIVTAGRLYRYSLVWVKTTPTGFLNAKRMPLRAHEEIIVCYKHPPVYHPQMTHGHVRKVSTAEHKRNSKMSSDYGRYKAQTYDSTDRYPTSVLRFSTDKQKSALHPTQKPVALLEYLIRTYTDEGDTVLDNCMGSGSTGVAAMNCGRNFIGMELDETIFELAKRRMIRLTQESKESEGQDEG